jgi:hypothetical protein
VSHYYAEEVLNVTNPNAFAFVFEINANGDRVIAECYSMAVAERIAAALNAQPQAPVGTFVRSGDHVP